nr:unnamed protein product [Haemonchus contortus]
MGIAGPCHGLGETRDANRLLLTDAAMVYIDSSGNVCENRSSIFSYILSFFSFIILFFKSLFGLGSGADDKASRDHLRRTWEKWRIPSQHRWFTSFKRYVVSTNGRGRMRQLNVWVAPRQTVAWDVVSPIFHLLAFKCA